VLEPLASESILMSTVVSEARRKKGANGAEQKREERSTTQLDRVALSSRATCCTCFELPLRDMGKVSRGGHARW
jgi:hypothetical protein